MKIWHAFAAGTATGIALVLAIPNRCSRHEAPVTATAVSGIERIVVRHDTVVVREPHLMVVHHRDTVADTLTVLCDSTRRVPVSLPIEQRSYSGDGYRAWISGYRPTLDSIAVVQTATTAVLTPATPRKQRWSVGICAGAGITPRGIEPFVGIGISYSIFSF